MKISKELVKEIMNILTMGAYPNVTVGKINEILNQLNNLDEDSEVSPKDGDKKGSTK